jgi:hypothetical protein
MEYVISKYSRYYSGREVRSRKSFRTERIRKIQGLFKCETFFLGGESVNEDFIYGILFDPQTFIASSYPGVLQLGLLLNGVAEQTFKRDGTSDWARGSTSPRAHRSRIHALHIFRL